MLSILFYLAVFGLVFILQLFAMKQKNKMLQKILVLGSFFVLLLLIGLRYKVGTDYLGHIGIYNDFSNRSFDSILTGSGDIGSKLIIGLAAHTFNDFKIIFWVYGLMTLYPIYKINKNSDFKYLAYSTLVFNLTVLPVSLNIIRQGAAMSFALLAFDYLRNNKSMLKIVVSMAIAVMLHPSALLMVPFLVLYRLFGKRKDKKFQVSMLIVVFGISLLFATSLKDVLNEIGFGNYTYMFVVSRELGLSLGLVFYNVVYYAMLLFMLLMYRKCKMNSDNDIIISKLFTILVAGSIFEIVCSMTKNLSRVSYYFSIYQILLIPLILQNISDKKTRTIMGIVCMAVLTGLFVLRCYVQGYYEIIPYQSWLFIG